MQGYIKLHRKIKDSEIWEKPSDYLKIWIYILAEVSYKNGKINEIGEAFFNKNDIAKNNFIRYHVVDNCVRWLKARKMITTQKTKRGLYIKVLRYAEYQELENKNNETDNEPDNEMKTKSKRNENETITKEVKEVKEKEIHKEKFGSHVLLNEKELIDLVGAYGKETIDRIIDDVNNYCSMHGKKYKDYAAAIRTFLKRDNVQKKFDLKQYDDETLAKLLKTRTDLHKQAEKERPTAYHLMQFLP